MSAYMIFTREKTLDKLELANYSKDAPATLVGHEVKVHALNGSHEDLERFRNHWVNCREK